VIVIGKRRTLHSWLVYRHDNGCWYSLFMFWYWGFFFLGGGRGGEEENEGFFLYETENPSLLVLELDLIDNLPVVIAHKVRGRDGHMELGLNILILHHLVILALRWITKRRKKIGIIIRQRKVYIFPMPYFRLEYVAYQWVEDNTDKGNAAKGLCPGAPHKLGERRCRMNNDPVVGSWVRNFDLVPVVHRPDRMYNRPR
jgi:hypothetical protein